MIAGPATFAWLLLVAQLLIFGTAAFALIAPDLPACAVSEFNRRLATLWRVLALALLVISPLAFMDMACGMAQMRWWQVVPLVPEIVRETDAGRVWIWRIGVVVILAAAAWIPLRARVLAIAMLLLTALLLILASITSHAIDFGRLAIAVYFVHQASAGVWIGALAALMLGCAGKPGRDDWIRAVTPRVSTIAFCAVGILTLTGLCNAYERIGFDLYLMIDAMYGRTLLWKLMTFAVIIAFAAHNRFRIVSRLEESSAREILLRNVAAECVLLAIVLAWSAMLANTPPPH
ncbi:MAG TPA: CopD family protein [Candidatus Binataceae bacterium]|nr:CopD family protein [Candidatus Binataceae bacterium]